jgi:serine/threonine protein kinase
MMKALLPCSACGAANEAGTISCSTCGQSFVSASAESSSQSGLLVSQRLLNDRYRIIDQVGKGGFGAVYRAADTQFGDRLVAIKEMAQKGLEDQELVEAAASFKHEALLLAHLQHPHLPRIYDHFSDFGRWYLVMDYIEGETLEDYLEKIPRDPRTGTRHLTPEEVLAIGIQLCTVLDYLHKCQPPIVFRDLKPANVMRTPDKHLYLIDFGIARHFKSGQIKDTMPLGSPGYAAPEQYGKRQTTSRADIYSLGVMLHQLLTGNDPANTPFRLAPLQFSGNTALSRLETLIKQMVDLDEEARPATVALVKEELQQIATQPLNKQIWSLPPEAPESKRFSPDASTAASGQQMAQQILEERPQQEEPPQDEQSVRRSPSRRAVVISLVGLAIAGGITWKWLTTSHSSPMFAPQAKPVMTPIKISTPFTYQGHNDRINTVAWSPDGKHIASASADRTVQVWEAATGHTTYTYTDPNIDPLSPTVGEIVYGAVWSPDSTKIASAHSEYTQEWQAFTGEHIFTYITHPAQEGSDMAWSPDGKYLAVATYVEEGTVQVWDVVTHQIVYKSPTSFPYAIAWSPDSKRIAIGTATTEIRVWDITTGDTFPIIKGHTGMVKGVTWSPDGKWIASASDDETVRIWEAKTGKAFRTMGKENVNVGMSTVAWSPDGRHIASSSNSSTIQVWDSKTGEILFVYNGHSGTITSVMWSPDSRYVVSGSEDHTVQIWPAP